jgi:phytoene dehydrogenase-like protein
MRRRLGSMSNEEIFIQPEKTTLAALQDDCGFSSKMIERFFRPFFSGIFLENNLGTSRRMFDFVFKMFGEGHAAVPNEGMEAIPRQLADNLLKENIRTLCKVERIEGNKIFTENGEIINAKNILLATEATSLIKNYYKKTNTQYVSTLHLHFISDTYPLQQPLIGLNTLPKKWVNNICTINKVAPGYARNGKNLISISVVGKPNLAEKEIIPTVRKEMSHWFGKQVEAWEHLATHLVEYALPVQEHVTHLIEDEALRISKNLYVCGDHLSNGSINAAMLSGRRAAEVIAKDMGV